MSLTELLPAVHSLPRSEKLELMQLLAVDLAHEEDVQLLAAGRAYAGSSQHDAIDAAKLLLQFLEDHKSKS